MARCRNDFCQLLNVHGTTDVRQTEKHTVEPLVPELSAFEVEIATEKLKSYKSRGVDHILVELIKAGGIKICPELHKLINSIWNKDELPEQWEESVVAPIYKKGNKTHCSNYCSISLLSTAFEVLSNILLSRLSLYAEEVIGDHQCGF
jgi:hypothetical protein